MSEKLEINSLLSEDKFKIFNEINQIHVQRFQLTLGAITVFGVFIGWVVTKENPATKQASDFLFAAPILLLIFLFLLFLYGYTLDRTLTALSTYLRVSKQSTWEEDFTSFRGRKSSMAVGYYAVENSIFILLGAVTASFPFILCGLTNIEFPSSKKVELMLAAFGLIYIIVVFVMSFVNPASYERDAIEKWEKILNK